MRVLKQSLLVSCALALLFVLTPGASASEWDQKVVATFNAPVEIPGHVLPTGTYVMKILNVMGSRDVVQVTNADESRVLATAFTIPRYRSTPTSNVVFLFEERGSDSPQALRGWYYPGFVDGHQFVYPAAVNIIAASSFSNEATANSPSTSEESSPVISDESKMSEAAPEIVAESSPSMDENQTETTPNIPTATPDQADKELPKTASTMPLIALVGILLLGGAVGLKVLASRVS